MPYIPTTTFEIVSYMDEQEVNLKFGKRAKAGTKVTVPSCGEGCEGHVHTVKEETKLDRAVRWAEEARQLVLFLRDSVPGGFYTAVKAEIRKQDL